MVSEYTASSGTTLYVNHAVWRTWATPVATTTDYTWQTWNATYVGHAHYNVVVPATLTDEQIEAEREARTLRVAERQRQIEEAKAKAEALLEANLNPGQLASYRKHGRFMVRGGASGKHYRIDRHQHGHGTDVVELNALGRVMRTFCTYVGRGHDIPTGDALLTKKLMLEYAEDRFLAQAY